MDQSLHGTFRSCYVRRLVCISVKRTWRGQSISVAIDPGWIDDVRY